MLFYSVFLAYLKYYIYLCIVKSNYKQMKLAIVGSRNAGRVNIGEYISERPSEIISGGARGIDSLAAQYAKEHGISLTEFLPDYDKYGRGAPIVRNRLIVQAADKVLAFWDGASRGTLSSINLAKKMGKKLQIVML